jgi:hypothetical protein
VICFVRNLHPKQTIYLPVSPGWARVLRPAVTTALPTAVLHTPAVRSLLTRQMITVVDGAAWDPDARQRRALKADMARAIAAAEQAEFDKLRVDMAPPRQRHKLFGKPRNRWTAERVAQLRTLLLSNAPSREITATLGLARGSLNATARRFGLTRQGRQQAATGRAGSAGADLPP